MPFNGPVYRFDDATINTINEVGGVYGLFQQTGPNYFVARYVGLGENLRRRLREHYNNPPISDITHFFAEVHTTAFARVLREQALIREFNPPGNVHHTR
jgi:hypothetical protein